MKNHLNKIKRFGISIISATISALVANFIMNIIKIPEVPGWMFLIVIFTAVGAITYILLITWQRPKDRKHLSSEDWLSSINDQLKNCSSARIYLRKFDHPESFKEKHKPTLMEIMETIKFKITNKADIKIISYNENGKKNGNRLAQRRAKK